MLVGEPHTEKEVAVTIHPPNFSFHGPRTGPYQGPGMLLPQTDRHWSQLWSHTVGLWYHLNRN